MTPNLYWLADPHSRMEYLQLGKIIIGRVLPDGGRNNRPRWIFSLASISAYWNTERTLEAAKAALHAAAMQWLKDAELVG